MLELRGPVAGPVRSLGFVKLFATAGLHYGNYLCEKADRGTLGQSFLLMIPISGEPEVAREKRLPTTLLPHLDGQPPETAFRLPNGIHCGSAEEAKL